MSDWSITKDASLSRLVQLGVTTESVHLDFKLALERGKPDAQAELGRDISQFANNQGGCLLIGVDERKDRLTGIKTAIAIPGVKDPDKDREDIETWIRNILVPADFSRSINFIQTQQGVVVAVNIPPSRRLIWVADPGQRSRLEVVRRTSHGKEYMRPAEIERHWSNTLRSAQISFHEAFEEAKSLKPDVDVDAEIVGGIVRVSERSVTRGALQKTGRSTVSSHDARGFVVRVPVGSKLPTLRIPFELLSTAWVDQGGVLHVLCRAPIIYDAQADLLRFDPFGTLERS